MALEDQRRLTSATGITDEADQGLAAAGAHLGAHHHPGAFTFASGNQHSRGGRSTVSDTATGRIFGQRKATGPKATSHRTPSKRHRRTCDDSEGNRLLPIHHEIVGLASRKSIGARPESEALPWFGIQSTQSVPINGSMANAGKSPTNAGQKKPHAHRCEQLGYKSGLKGWNLLQVN